jgi:hypothetical protein
VYKSLHGQCQLLSRALSVEVRGGYADVWVEGREGSTHRREHTLCDAVKRGIIFVAGNICQIIGHSSSDVLVIDAQVFHVLIERREGVAQHLIHG